MMRRSLLAVFIAALLAVSYADLYIHMAGGFGGSNDRCDEKSNNRNNANRMFDSENNAAGGYNICDGEMKFYEDTNILIEWHSQHSCGNGATNKDDTNNPEIVHCQHIIQLGCEDNFAAFAGPEADTYKLTEGISLGRPCADRDAECAGDPEKLAAYNTFGSTCTQTRPTTAQVAALGDTPECPDGFINIPECNDLELENERGTFNSNTCKCSTRKLKTYGLHEPEHWYVMCRARERNRGLFTATQNVNNNNGATRTRQEPNSARYGFECTEERDYYPYWHPSPWIDLAIFVSDLNRCSFYQAESQNVIDKCHCIGPAGSDLATNVSAYFFNNALDCTSAVDEEGEELGYVWKCWGKWDWPAPECLQAPWQPDNRLGSTMLSGDKAPGQYTSNLAHYNWQIPRGIVPDGRDSIRCVIRMRYNISTFETKDEYNVRDNKVARQNPIFSFGSGDYESDTPEKVIPLRLAINTAQYGRTFEDRGYPFTIMRRPAELAKANILNFHVRGKRGNIAQVRNCFEYDFVPHNPTVEVGDYIHFQWCGSDYNDNGNAGEGRAGTDRSNIVPVIDFAANVFASQNDTSRCRIFDEETEMKLAWLGQEVCEPLSDMLTKNNDGNNPKACQFLNGVRDERGLPTGYFSHLAEVKEACQMKFISSRNNNFSNRSQKGVITATPKKSTSTAVIVGAVIGAIVGVALIAGAVFLVATNRISFGMFRSKV